MYGRVGQDRWRRHFGKTYRRARRRRHVDRCRCRPVRTAGWSRAAQRRQSIFRCLLGLRRPEEETVKASL